MLGDFGGGGMLLALGIVSALLHARESGQGQVVDASILDGTALLTAMVHAMRFAEGWAAPRGENLFDGGAPYYGVYQCADGGWLSVGAIEPRFYAELASGLGLAAELPPEAQHDRAQWPRQRELIAATVVGRTRDEWVAAFAGLDACVAPVLAPGEVLAHPDLAARRVFTDVDGLVHPEPGPALLPHAGRAGPRHRSSASTPRRYWPTSGSASRTSSDFVSPAQFTRHKRQEHHLGNPGNRGPRHRRRVRAGPCHRRAARCSRRARDDHRPADLTGRGDRREAGRLRSRSPPPTSPTRPQ